jgi:hypothetical protein
MAVALFALLFLALLAMNILIVVRTSPPARAELVNSKLTTRPVARPPKRIGRKDLY